MGMNEGDAISIDFGRNARLALFARHWQRMLA